MPLPGGPADKLGNRYENWWTVWQLVRMLQGTCESIRIENPGVDKAEFVLSLGGRQEWHQAKRSHPSGRWTLATLGGSDVELLQAVGKLLDGNADRFVFVSTTDARELAELSDRARQAASVNEFETVFLSAKEQTDNFARLLLKWPACDVQAAYDRLQRIYVRTVDERSIEELSRSGIAAVCLSKADDVVAALRIIAEDSIHKTITREDLIASLAARGFVMRRAIRQDSAAAMAEDATRRYLESVRGKLIRQTLIPRTETQAVLGILGDRARDVVLTGRAGGGKTGCVVELVDELRARGIPVLALRLDRVEPVSTAQELGRKAGLEDSPAVILAGAAEGREAVLIIDQLDAISTASGRSSGFFDAVDGVLTETRGLRERANIHLVVVSRQFDWENDHRLKKLVSHEHLHVTVDMFPLERARELLAAGGFDSSLFAPRQLDLLRLPQNLSLFFGAGFDPLRAPTFSTAAELFDRYWKEKRRAVRQRAGGAQDQWMDVIGILVDEMTRTQQLSVPHEKLDAIDPEYLDQMSSEGVLTFDGRRYGFGHESFFDYCFARTFLTRKGTLLDLLASDEQHLFRRSQVRQVLTYVRDTDRARYLGELKAIVTGPQVRAHIKDLTFALLGSVTDPSDEEWEIWEPLLRPMLDAFEAGEPNRVEKLEALSWQHFFGSFSWFEFALRKGLVHQWLAADGPLANMAVHLLRFHERHAADIVAELLEPYVDAGGDWPIRLRLVAQWSDHTSSRRFFDLTLRLIDNGVLDDARGPIAANSTFWTLFYQLGKQCPEWVPEVISHWLRRRLAVKESPGDILGRADVFGEDQFAAEPIGDAAENAPAEFVRHVLPIVLEISDRAVYRDAARPRHDAAWPALFKTPHLGADGACLVGLDKALAKLASGGHDLRPVVDELRRPDTYIANHLLQVLYAAGAEQYADEAAEMLVSEPWRFECGYSDSSHWTSMELVRAISPRCGSEVRAKLEATILAYRSPWERTEDGYKQAGFSSFSLLSAFPPELLSSVGRTRVGELERKFRRPATAPRGVGGGIVGSPIQKDAAGKMTDDQWLRAIEKYRSENSFTRIGDSVQGGAWQLSQTLESLVGQQPERFAKLALRFPSDVNPVYFDRTLAGLKKSTIPSELKLAVCRKAFTEARSPCGQAIADVLGASEDTLPEDAIVMLISLATEHPESDREAHHDGDIHLKGINSTRGRAADAIRDLVLQDAAYLPRFRDALEHMVKDPSICVGSCVAGTLRAVAYHDPTLALELFGRMDTQDDRLLATHHVYEFIRSLLREHFDELRPTIERMLRSGDADVAQAGARLAGLAALHHEHAAYLDHEAATGGAYQRRGLAEVAAANIASEECRAWCERHLTAFFDDDDDEVRKEAAGCFRQLSDESLELYEPLIAAFVDSVAYRDDSMSILHFLEKSLRRLPGITSLVCEKFLRRFSDEARDVRTRRMGDVRTVTQLVFRTYHQHQDDEWTAPALDLIDRLCLEGIRDARREFDTFER